MKNAWAILVLAVGPAVGCGDDGLETTGPSYSPPPSTPYVAPAPPRLGFRLDSPVPAFPGPYGMNQAIVHADPVLLEGTAAADVTSLQWRNDTTGQQGSAEGIEAWNAAVPLTLGTNRLTLTAVSPGRLEIVTVEFHFSLQVAVFIPGPAELEWYGAGSHYLQGLASSPNGITEVTWSCAGASGTATGTSSWSAWIPVAEGTQELTVTARDGYGQASVSVTITVIPAYWDLYGLYSGSSGGAGLGSGLDLGGDVQLPSYSTDAGWLW